MRRQWPLEVALVESKGLEGVDGCRLGIPRWWRGLLSRPRRAFIAGHIAKHREFHR